MKTRAISHLFLCIVLLTQPFFALAFETDQYNLPPQPLADIGDEVTEYVVENLRKAVEKLNNRILVSQSCLEKNTPEPERKNCDSSEKEQNKLARLRSEDAIAQEVYNLLGAGYPPFTKSGTWMDNHYFKAQPARYKTSYGKSIFLILPINYLTISPTVNLYKSEFGTDKIAHFFQQGYSYYKIYKRAQAKGMSAGEAAKKAVRWGQRTEHTFYGTLVSGVFSNADLCANYVGMKFYLGLTQPIEIGNVNRPAILLLKNGVWTFNKNADLKEMLLKPFLSNHLNEALNPSIFVRGLRSFVRRTVRKQSCKHWLSKYPSFSQADFYNLSQPLKLWYGEDYGFTESKKFVTIANTCFSSESEKSIAEIESVNPGNIFVKPGM